MIRIGICEKLLKLAGGEELPASSLKNAIAEELINEGIISERISGRTKRTLYIPDAGALHTWLWNRHTIYDLAEYVRVLQDVSAGRAELVQVSNDSKTRNKRAYKGFLVNSYLPISATLNGEPHLVAPKPGTFEFVYDFEHFLPAPDVTIVGIENMEVFRNVDKLEYLFSNINPLFICRYPQQQTRDAIKWLMSVSNSYVHFGDYDFAGINIYLQEYKKHLGIKASFFIPAHIEELMARHGNPSLYDRQKLTQAEITEENIKGLISLIHRHKRGLEQEALLIM